MGSMIQVGLSVRTLGAPAATDSSPMKLENYRQGKHEQYFTCDELCSKTKTMVLRVEPLWPHQDSVASDAQCRKHLAIHSYAYLVFKRRWRASHYHGSKVAIATSSQEKRKQHVV